MRRVLEEDGAHRRASGLVHMHERNGPVCSAGLALRQPSAAGSGAPMPAGARASGARDHALGDYVRAAVASSHHGRGLRRFRLRSARPLEARWRRRRRGGVTRQGSISFLQAPELGQRHCTLCPTCRVRATHHGRARRAGRARAGRSPFSRQYERSRGHPACRIWRKGACFGSTHASPLACKSICGHRLVCERPAPVSMRLAFSWSFL